MDGIKQQVHARQIEAIETKHNYETRKLTRELRSELDEVKNQKLAAINHVKKEYDKRLLDEKNSLEMELTRVRRNNAEILKTEEQRYEDLLEEVQASHSTKLAEMKISQEKEIEKRTREHQESLDNLEQKYEQASIRLKA